MRLRAVILALSAAAALGACAVNIQDHAPPAPAIDAQGLVDARQGGMAMSVGALGAVSAGYDKKAVARSYRLPAEGLANFAASLPALFDDRTAGVSGTGASPAIWSDRTGFAARTVQYRDATGALLAAIDAGDDAGIAAALASTKAACKACHDTYRTQ
jgi:cytochrome c556